MWRSRLFWRFFFSILLVVVMTALLSVQFERYLQQQNTGSHVNKTVAKLTDFQSQISHLLDEEDFDGVAELLNRHPRYREQFLVFDDNDNEILGRDKLTTPRFRQHFQRQLAKDFAQRGLALSTLVVSIYGNEFIIDIHPTMSFHPLLSPRVAGTVIRVVLLLLISGLICYWLTQTLTRRIRVLQRATHRIALGEYDRVFTDNTAFQPDELGQLGKDVQSLAKQLDNGEKARKQMLSDISHELRSPLSRMQVAIELGKNQLEHDPDKAQNALQRIELETTRMEQLIAQIIQLQQLQLREHQRIETTDNVGLIDLLTTVIDDVRYEYQQQHKTIRLSHDNTALFVAGQNGLLASALENIIRNAMSHTVDNSCVEVELHQKQSHIVIRVQDAGEGVPDKDIPRLFEPFVRIDSSRNRRTGGFGLGLSLARAIIEAHSGTLQAKNRDNASGLEITVIFPAISPNS